MHRETSHIRHHLVSMSSKLYTGYTDHRFEDILGLKMLKRPIFPYYFWEDLREREMEDRIRESYRDWR